MVDNNHAKRPRPENVLHEIQELRDIYLEILRIEARLVNMEQKHPATARIRDVISKALDELEDVRHLLMQDATRLVDGGEPPETLKT